MKEILLRYTSYNVWANRHIVNIVSTLSDEQIDEELGGSFGSIRKTIHHIWGAESIWHQRLCMSEQVVSPAVNFEGNIMEACKNWQDVSNELMSFVEKQKDEKFFSHEFRYFTLKKDPKKSQVWEALQHCMNHSTFHRGQLINYFRKLGVTKIPPTDFIAYCWERKNS